MPTKKEIREFVASKLYQETKDLTDDVDIVGDLGVSKLDFYVFQVDMEDQYGVHVPDEGMGSIRKFGDMVAYIQKRAPKKHRRKYS
jgi:acyl carrier protein